MKRVYKLVTSIWIEIVVRTKKVINTKNKYYYDGGLVCSKVSIAIDFLSRVHSKE